MGLAVIENYKHSRTALIAPSETVVIVSIYSVLKEVKTTTFRKFEEYMKKRLLPSCVKFKLESKYM